MKVRRQGDIDYLCAVLNFVNYSKFQYEILYIETISKGQHEKAKDLSDDISLSSEATQVKERGKCSAKDASILSQDMDVIECAEDVSFSLGAAGANLLKDNFNAAETERKANSDEDISGGPESLTYPSLQEKVAKFIQDGELDDIEGKSFIYKWPMNVYYRPNGIKKFTFFFWIPKWSFDAKHVGWIFMWFCWWCWCIFCRLSPKYSSQ